MKDQGENLDVPAEGERDLMLGHSGGQLDFLVTIPRVPRVPRVLRVLRRMSPQDCLESSS